MPDYSTLSSQVDLFKTKVTALSSTTLDANDLVLLASALNTLAESMGVNDVAAATLDRIAAIETAKLAAITTINNSVNGDRLTDLETDSTNYGTRLTAIESYNSGAAGNISAIASTVATFDSAVRPNVMLGYSEVTALTHSAARGERLLVVPAAGQVITLPATPNLGDSIDIIDAAGTAGVTNFLINRNTKLIQGLAEDLTVDVASASFTLVYYNATYGWRIV